MVPNTVSTKAASRSEKSMLYKEAILPILQNVPMPAAILRPILSPNSAPFCYTDQPVFTALPTAVIKGPVFRLVPNAPQMAAFAASFQPKL